MRRIFNNLPLRGSLERTLEGIGDIRDTIGEVVCGRNGNNYLECGCS